MLTTTNKAPITRHRIILVLNLVFFSLFLLFFFFSFNWDLLVLQLLNSLAAHGLRYYVFNRKRERKMEHRDQVLPEMNHRYPIQGQPLGLHW